MKPNDPMVKHELKRLKKEIHKLEYENPNIMITMNEGVKTDPETGELDEVEYTTRILETWVQIDKNEKAKRNEKYKKDKLKGQ